MMSVAAVPVGPSLPENVSATVLTSRNAVPGCPESCFAKPAFTVGSATAAAARSAGFVNVIDADADASVLPDLIADTISASGQTLFLPVGRGLGGDLTRALRLRGFRVIRRVAYQTAAAAALPGDAAAHLRQEDLSAALFFSAETARTFVRLVQAAGLTGSVADVEAVSISERSAMALRSLPWRRISIAAKPNQDAMLVLLK
jgi:uroporphyrinogen-III synthase